MRELTVRIRFTSHSLGNQKLRDGTGRFVFQRGPSGHILFLSTWHLANMRLAAQLLGRHQDVVQAIYWDIRVDGALQSDPWYRVYHRTGQGSRQRYSQHEAFYPNQIVGINCVVPPVINDDDFWRLMTIAGQYKGLSPWKPGEYGFYSVESLRQRRAPTEDEADITMSVKDAVR